MFGIPPFNRLKVSFQDGTHLPCFSFREPVCRNLFYFVRKYTPMFKQVLPFLLLLGPAACKDGDKEKAKPKAADAPQTGITAAFKEASLPYQLSDTALLRNNDTASLPASAVSPLIADSLRNKYFGKGASIKYTPLAKLTQKGKDVYCVVKAAAGARKAAFLLVFDKGETIGASYPFLLPDADGATAQSSSVDKNFTVTKTVTLRNGSDIVGEGKEVVAYDAGTKAFSLILSDALADKPAELVNPIDTFPRKNGLAGDYYLNKRNLVSVRDGRTPAQVLVFIHTENEAGDCTGQLRGEFIVTSSASAAYRPPGDPCVLNLVFKNNTVSVSEEKGCGNYRGLDCPLSGTFTRKKAQPAKPASVKPKRK